MSVKSIKGFADMFPPESDAFLRMESTARTVFSRYGFVELRTPLLERTELFCRSIGEETDVVQKEMYTFPDRKGRSLTLRPEATAGVMRAYIEAALHTKEPVSRLFTTGPMFRYERPQKGRMRQFHQINCECIGSPSPYVDAEIIVMLMHFLNSLSLGELTLKLNSLGCAACRPVYKAALSDFLRNIDAAQLCEDCRRRMDTNPLRVLDCKVPACKALTEKAPSLHEHSCPDCVSHFATVTRLLEQEHISFELDSRLVRGLDYYCRTTFEVVSGGIGAQSSIAGGGRYDGLVRQVGGPDVPGIGFACGMERLALLMPEIGARQADCFMVAVGEKAQDVAFHIIGGLRLAGIHAAMGQGGGFKSQMRQADKSGARLCCILGEDELASGTLVLKNMRDGTQQNVRLDAAQQILRDAFSHIADNYE